MTQKNSLSVIVFEKSPARAREITKALSENGWAKAIVISDVSTLVQKIEAIDPDAVLIDLENPRRERVEALSAVSGAETRPVAMFVDKSDPELSRAAVNAGLSAYVVSGLVQNRIRPVLETAIARFQLMAKVRSELEAARADLAARKTIEQAKSLLIKAKGLTEEEAYQLLRRAAMDQGKRINDVAQGLITASKLLS